MTMSVSSIKEVLDEAHLQARAIAQGSPESEQIRILAIAIAETARASRAIADRLAG